MKPFILKTGMTLVSYDSENNLITKHKKELGIQLYLNYLIYKENTCDNYLFYLKK